MIMQPKRIVLALLSAALLATTPVNSTAIRTVDVAALTAGADIIVVGKVLSVVQEGTTTLDLGAGPIAATQFVGVLRVDQVLKGIPEMQNLSFGFDVPDMPLGLQGVVAGEYGLFFLVKTQNQLRFFDPMHPLLPAVPAAQLPSGAPLDQVTTSLGQVLNSLQASDSDQIQALDALGRLKTDFARDILRQAMNSSHGNLRLDIARTLVARSDVVGLEPVEAALLHPAGLSEYMVSNLAGSLAGLRDPKAVPSLSRLIATNNSDTRLGAAIGLRQSGSAAALVPLSHALNDVNGLIRYYAVVGMGEITKQDECTPAFDEFQKNEAHYLSYWRKWAESNLQRN